ncbi:uncharacterized protein LOC119672513 [Teleopsis dalmanni]|uniref:uncharacterized protein LOC119672513 n=1 Tax=Teleopsis dalmanni TaxID=139649 RepID=UPI0018CEE325|nr:uncharacterized protein LOC119672513 [Teleopsis dalmanni]
MEKSGNSEEDSLGILNMDNIKVFGDLSANNSSSRQLSGILLEERKKALQLLEKKGCASNKENVPNIKLNNITVNDILKSSSVYNSTKSNETRINDSAGTFSFSDFVGCESTKEDNLQTSTNTLAEKLKISFEPNEITGRSTLCKQSNASQNPSRRDSTMSTKDILNSSISMKLRNLSENLKIDSVSTDWNNYSHVSLPRTADLSKSRAAHSDFSFNGGDGLPFSTDQQLNFTGLCNEEFKSYKSIEDKLLSDEKEWAQEFAVMPVAEKNKDFSALSFNTNNDTKNDFMADFSVGTFFKGRSEDIRNIVKAISPEKNRSPIALVDDDNMVQSATSFQDEETPKIDNKTYSRAKYDKEKHESKDSGNSSDNSFFMSMSAIGRALSQLNINSNDSYSAIKNQMLQYKTKKNSNGDSKQSPEMEKKSMEKKDILNMIEENKENMDPQVLENALSDTISLRESFLNCSDVMPQRRSITSPNRSPLSPIVTTHDKDNGNDADVDEWGTPICTTNRKKRLTKSPNFKTKAAVIENHNTVSSSSVSKQSERNNEITNAEKSVTKNSLNSLENLLLHVENLSEEQRFLLSSIQSKINHQAPLLSPLSSPRSNLSSQTCSPTTSDGYRSPNFNSTTNSERRFLSLGNLGKATSPVTSESNVHKYVYGAVPVRSASTISTKSNASGVSRSISRASNSSEFSHRDGKIIPLKLTKLELSWGSIKLRKEVRQSVQIKNTSEKRLVIRHEIFGPGYQLINTSSNILTLQAQECHSIIISFCPTITGVAIGGLNFYPPHRNANNTQPFLVLPLFGYGGHSSISIDGILIGPVGSPFLPLGDAYDLKPNSAIIRTFNIINKGPLPSFHAVSVNLIGLSRLSINLEIQPSKLLLDVGQEATIRIIFHPKREDIKKIINNNSNVYTLADMHIISGDQANKQRIKRLLKRMPKEDREKVNSLVVEKISSTFPNEVMFPDLDVFKESVEVDNIAYLLSFLRIDEIALTLNHSNSLNETSDMPTLFFSEADETILFRTVCIPSPTSQKSLEPVDELLEKTMGVSESNLPIESTTNKETWSVSPTSIIYNLNNKRRDKRLSSLLIKNFFKSRQYFDVTCSQKNLFTFTPNQGFIEPEGGQIEVDVHAIGKPTDDLLKARVFILVYLDNYRITVPVTFQLNK